MSQMRDCSITRKGDQIAFIGNCQALALGELYRDYFALDRNETIVILADVDLVGTTADAGIALLAECDVVVEQVLAWRPPIQDVVTRARRHIRFPMVTGWFLWPFSGEAHPRNAECLWPGFHGPYPAEYGDTFLNRKIGEGADPEGAIAEYMQLDIARIANLARRYEILLEQQRQRDAETDFSLASLIDRRLSSEPLFTSRGHPTKRLFVPLATGAFEQMGIPLSEIARLIISLDQPPFPADQAPIHPAVAAHFGLSYVTRQTKFAFGGGHFQFEHFAARYMNFQWNEPLARALSQCDAFPDAQVLSIVDQALASEPECVPGSCLRARLLQRLGHPDKAIAAAQAACAMAGGDIRPIVLLAELQQETGSPSAAAETARQALALHPFFPPAHAALAAALLALNEPTASAKRPGAFVPSRFAPTTANLEKHLAEMKAGYDEGSSVPGAVREQAELLPSRRDRSMSESTLKPKWKFDFNDPAADPRDLLLLGGWAGPERGFIWMVGEASSLVMPLAEPVGDLLVELECWPHINDRGLNSQRLSIGFNGLIVASFVISQYRQLRCRIEKAVIFGNRPMELSFFHPDAATPASLPDLGNADQRALAIAMVSVSVTDSAFI